MKLEVRQEMHTVVEFTVGYDAIDFALCICLIDKSYRVLDGLRIRLSAG